MQGNTYGLLQLTDALSIIRGTVIQKLQLVAIKVSEEHNASIFKVGHHITQCQNPE
jgi:hypothetical protein